MIKTYLKTGLVTLLLGSIWGGLSAQNSVNVRGTVTDNSGDPLIGVTVRLESVTPTVVVVTDLDGVYDIYAPSDGTLTFTYIGYAQATEKINGRTEINVVMKEEATELEQVVVIGYGTMDKKELTSSISHVGEKDFLSVSSLDASMLIQGKVPGVSITNTGAGDPNNQASIQIRGISSRSAGLGPLIVIDGVPGGNLTNLNPNDIASFDILKDGAASAIYGTRGSNGVILITTKKGTKDGATHTTYQGNFSWNHAIKELDMLSAQEYRDLRLANGDNGIDLGGNYDWWDGVTRTGFTMQHTLTVSGGNERSNYRVTADFRNADGIDIRSSRKEYGARATVNHTTKNGLFNIVMNLAPRVIYREGSDWSVFKSALEANPTTPLMDPNDPTRYYNFVGQVVAYNPVEELKTVKNSGNTKLLDWDGTVKLNLLPLFYNNEKNPLTLNTQVMFGEHQWTNDNSWFRPSTNTQAINGGHAGEANRSYTLERQYILEWITNFTGRFGDNNLKAMVGYSYQYSQNSGFNAENKDFPNDGLGADNLGTGEYMLEEGQVGMGSYKNDSKLISFFGRVSYDYDGRYLLTASLRHEGSSKFGANHKWGNFPAVSVGWRISQEKFMENASSWLNELKIRADYGVTGNQDFNSYLSLNTMTGFGYYYYNGQYFQVWGPSKNVNPDLRWEKGKNWNVGVDFSLFDNRVFGSLNYYSRHQQDLLGNYNVSLPPYLFETTFVNVGTMRNTGFEFDITYNAVRTKDFDYNFSVIGSTMSNKFIDFSNSEYVGQDYYDQAGTSEPYPYYNLQRIEKGKSLGNFYMWKYAGISEDGEWLVYDKDGDIINRSQATDDDRQIVGNGLPKFTLSSTHNFRYKNFDLTLFFRGAFGFDLFNIHDFYYGTRNFTGNPLKKAYTKNFPISPTVAPIVCDYFLERGDYFKLDQITLGYTLPVPHARFLNSMRFFGTVKNVFTITKFSGIDPSNYQANGLTPGAQADRSYYPSVRQFILGIQLDF